MERMLGLKTASVLVLLLFGCGCAHVYTARGVYHRVQSGETFSSLAERYHVPLQRLAELNNVENPGEVRVGQMIFVPGAKARGFVKPRWAGKKGKRKGAETTGIEVDHSRFSWPVEGELTSLYGVRHSRRHDGIDIKASRGTPILAADDGSVVYSKRLRGYGNLILLKHDENFFTVYAHTQANLVKKGAKVEKGQVIAKVGSTGRTTGPHLHFEVRRGRETRNPLFFLPKRAFVAKALKEQGAGTGGGQ